MSIFETLQDPSVSFSSPFITITYSPGGLAYTFSPVILSWLEFFFSLFWPLFFIVVVSSLTYYFHSRLSALERVSTKPIHPISPSQLSRLLAILHHTLHALSLYKISILEALETLANDLRALITSLDADIATLDSTFTRQIRLHLGVLTSLEHNLDQARILLGAGVDVDGSEAGLDVGDDMQTFWPEEDGEVDSKPGDDDEVDESIDIEASDELVFGWLGRIAGPDECWDEWE